MDKTLDFIDAAIYLKLNVQIVNGLMQDKILSTVDVKGSPRFLLADLKEFRNTDLYHRLHSLDSLRNDLNTYGGY